MQHPLHVHRETMNRMVSGVTVFSLVEETSVPEEALHRRKHQSSLCRDDGPDHPFAMLGEAWRFEMILFHIA